MKSSSYPYLNQQDSRWTFSRRTVLAVIASIAGAGGFARTVLSSSNLDVLARLEHEVGGRIGLAALDTASGRRLSYRANERFAMCSTFKLMLAAAILARVDSGSLRLDQPVSFARSDILPTSPIAEVHPEGGAEPLSRMLQSLVETSDNTTANRVLALIGGPAGYTTYLRSIGDPTTRLDRIELDLNSNLPGDFRDTTTPNAMVEDMRRVLVGDRLTSDSRERLQGWLRECQTGHDRLRALLTGGWEAGDKTGTGARGAVNDLAIFFAPKRAPVLVACYMSGSAASRQVLNEAHARIGLLVASKWP
jgi:beta-lactamase class A